MKPFDHQSLEEQTRLVSRYVAGDLSRSERAEFEAWLVAAPELAAEVEMERRLRRGIASAARLGWLKRGTAEAASRERRWRMAIAASVVLALVTVGMTLVLPRNPGQSTSLPPSAARGSAPARIATLTVRLSPVRGATVRSPDLAFTRADAPAELVLEPDVVVLTCEDGSVELECAGGAAPYTPQYPEYVVELVSRRDETVAWRSTPQAPVARTQLSFAVPDPGALDTGDYTVIVRGQSADHAEVVARFWLRIGAQ